MLCITWALGTIVFFFLDKAREKCDFLQIVLNLDESNTAIGDLTSRLGEVTVVDIKEQFSKTSKSIFRDQELSSLAADLIGGSRSLYLVLFDDRHKDSFLACSKIRYHKPVIVKLALYFLFHYSKKYFPIVNFFITKIYFLQGFNSIQRYWGNCNNISKNKIGSYLVVFQYFFPFK